MKKKLLTAVLSATMLASGLASAGFSDCDTRFYLGAEIQAHGYKSKTLTLPDGDKVSLFGDRGAGFTGFIGLRINPCFGLELGYTGMSDHTLTITDPLLRFTITTKSSNGYLDALGYLPITDCLDAVGSLGVGFLSTKVNANLSTTLFNINLLSANGTSIKAGARVGLGLDYKLGENFGTRFMVRYQSGNDYIKNLTSAALGLYYQF